MPKNIPITLACGDYEIVRALKDGLVEPDGIDLTILTDMDSTTRHWRFIRQLEFDMAETSGSSYIVARDKGVPVTALPVFLHRRFRHGFVFINTTKGIKEPKDLIGKKIGIKSFLVSAGHWMRGILEHEYGVPHKSIEWFTELDEDVDFEYPKDLKVTKLPHEKSVEKMLAEGELDAVLHSDLIKPMLAKDPRVARLFPDYVAEEKSFFRKTGIFPIMHVMGLDPELVESINVNLGATDVDSPTASAAGGTINIRSLMPSDEMGAMISASTTKIVRTVNSVRPSDFMMAMSRAFSCVMVEMML